MGKAPPAFQFYPNDFVTGTRKMTTSEVGGYILLLCAEWDDGFVPGDDLLALAAIMRCSRSCAKSIWTRVSYKFVRDERGEWRNGRIEQVRREQDAYRDGKSRSGKAGAEARWQKDGSGMTEGMPNASQEVCQTDGPPISDLQSPLKDESKNDSSLLAPHGVKAFLTEHERLFTERYHAKPAKYGGKDAKHAKDTIDRHGLDGALLMLRQFFASRDPFIAGCGHGLGLLASGTVQNKLIAEASGVAPKNDGRDWAREFIANG